MNRRLALPSALVAAGLIALAGCDSGGSGPDGGPGSAGATSQAPKPPAKTSAAADSYISDGKVDFERFAADTGVVDPTKIRPLSDRPTSPATRACDELFTDSGMVTNLRAPLAHNADEATLASAGHGSCLYSISGNVGPGSSRVLFAITRKGESPPAPSGMEASTVVREAGDYAVRVSSTAYIGGDGKQLSPGPDMASVNRNFYAELTEALGKLEN